MELAVLHGTVWYCIILYHYDTIANRRNRNRKLSWQHQDLSQPLHLPSELYSICWTYQTAGDLWPLRLESCKTVVATNSQPVLWSIYHSILIFLLAAAVPRTKTEREKPGNNNGIIELNLCIWQGIQVRLSPVSTN